ncbi:chemotaxis protein partial : CheA signal transduction histidine kinase OS=Xanthomonas fuscans subsp. aurantifolii str. ICPB 10535 GN=XAUC_02840 PE=4 SV=1: Hpt: H-kinase_dim: HATPase_c: CheW: Response_reg [Gemmataceae bacterium]|nr:chemotaxis protein partial : CheA signal transduction histidine kinase OS=Xanthomonas fuscans subsp. aurantifolii str. ICPB 10535 GN=XAUC_02840 PE=4 SV=1: Hpt: H-kinase_dim: HATPase_c: CheW: Response_reg [Gemmataceae bacterium]VTT97770.1 chemotaxis protein partial : CheA signal transduction histidine kinase OS=Xanthomonas fuscans subsp. aurantifolii str. ICPB 10535 GN=XAUC_02840 PE=4 SV=1: Hpt: H-kinase_dim: HATPase_c: CheW: Response_reg [Gemmataceae bacterium]
MPPPEDDEPNWTPPGDADGPEWEPPAATEEPPLAAAGVPEPAAAIDPEILEVFAAEAEEHVALIGRTLPLYQQQPGNKEHLQEIRRAAHTLKGAAASVGFTLIAKLAHRAEDLLDALYDGDRPATPGEVELLFAAHDALEDLAAGRAGEEVVAALAPRFEAAVAAIGARPAAPPEPAAEVEVDQPTVAADAAAVRAAGEALRVPIARVDEVVNLVGELVISRSGFEQHLGKLSRLLQELQLSADRLRRATGKIETQYEARALASNRLANRLGGSDGAGHGFDGLEFDRYTDFHLMIRELSETSTDLATVSQELSGLTGEFDGYLVRQSRLTAEMQDKLMRVRMVPLGHLSGRLHRTVRRTAADLGKQVRLVLEGENTDLDKTVLEEMAEPLLHLLRNAIDHGIEDAAAREAAGKPAAGTVRVRAAHEGTQIVIRVSDDGRGIDYEAVRLAAVARGALSPEAAAIASPDELTDLLFRSGFSTAGRVTEISGRGVGLDVVRALVERLKGTVSLASDPGRGATFTVRLPLTLAVIRALLVEAEGHTFALPLGSVTQILRLDPEQCGRIGSQDVARVGPDTLPRFSLAARLGLRGTTEPDPRPPAVVIEVGDRRHVVVLDRIAGGREVVVKSLGTHVRHAPGIAGATLMGDGSVVLILDPAELCAPARAARPAHPAPVAHARHAQRPPAEQLTVLVVDDSPSVRRFVSGQLRDAGMDVLTAKDGLDALEVLHHAERLPDVVMLDVEMPRMDGYELLSTLRATPAHQSLPVVMLTSRAGDKHRRKAMELGATAYLVKPYQPAELLRVLRDAAAAPATA